MSNDVVPSSQTAGSTAGPGATAERPGVSLDWFNTLYRILLGEEKGPRFGSFVAIYGLSETRTLIENALSGALRREHEGTHATA